MFWGVIIKPDKRYEQTVEDPFHISKACIEPTTSKGKITSVYVESNDEEFLVCNLSDKILNETLDLNFNMGDKIVFKTSGTGVVHLTGYNIQEEEGPSMFEDEDDYSSEDEAAEVEEIPALVNGKKRKAGASGDEATPATKKRNERKAAIEMAKKIANTIKKADNDEDESDDEDYEDVDGEGKFKWMETLLGEDEEGEEEEDSSDDEETEADDTLDESGVIRRGLSILESTMEGDTTVGDSTLDTSEIDTSAMDTSAMDTSAADTPAKPIAVKAEKAKTPAKAEKAKTPAKAAKDTPAKAAKDTPAKAAKDTPAKAEKVEKEVNDKENETTNKPAEEDADLSKSAKKKKKEKKAKGEDSPVKPVAETKTEEVVETKTPKKEATEAKKTPAKTPKRTLKGGIQLEDLKVKKK